MFRIIESVPVELLRQEGYTREQSLHIHRLVEDFNRYCNRGVDIMGCGAELPLFSTRRELVRLHRDGKPLILRREWTEGTW